MGNSSSKHLVFSPAPISNLKTRSSNNNNNNNDDNNNNNNRNCNHDHDHDHDHYHYLHIPGDVIQEILLRLPVKSLIRFKCVCKSWFSLISDPHFAESHFNQALTPPSHRLLLIVPIISYSAFKAYSFDIDASLHHHSTIQLPNIITNRNLSSYRFRGSCRGFVLLDDYRSRNLLLWNPSTGSHKTLPSPPILFSDMCHVSSLGYDVATDDYLVLVMGTKLGIDNLIFRMGILSVRTNSWEQMSLDHEPFMGSINLVRESGLFFNGVFHWLPAEREILCLDLRSKKFSKMDAPEAFCHSGCEPRVMVLRGCLAMCHCKEIWVMKEYKVHSSWTKLGDLYDSEVCVVHINNFCEVIGVRDQSPEPGITVVKLNDKGEELECREFSCYSFEVREALYMESLLSLPGK